MSCNLQTVHPIQPRNNVFKLIMVINADGAMNPATLQVAQTSMFK